MGSVLEVATHDFLEEASGDVFDSRDLNTAPLPSEVVMWCAVAGVEPRFRAGAFIPADITAPVALGFSQ